MAGATALSAGLNFLGGMFGNSYSANYNAEEAQKDRDFQREMYEKQYQDNIKFWQMQNDYNLPSAQLQRIRDAGMNPLLAYGQGGLSGNIASQSPESPTAPHGAHASSHFNNPIDMPNLALLDAQIDNLRADSEQKRAAAGESGAKTENLKFDLDFKRETKDIDISLKVAEFDYKKAMQNLSYFERLEISSKIRVADKEIEHINAQISNESELTKAKVNDINQRLEGFNKQLSHVIANMDAQTRLYYAQAFKDSVEANFMKDLYDQGYISILKGQAGQDLLNAIAYGDQIAIENGLRGIEFMMQPKPGEGMYDYGRVMKFGVLPTLEAAKDVVITGVGVYGAGKLRFPTKSRPIGFNK